MSYPQSADTGEHSRVHFSAQMTDPHATHPESVDAVERERRAEAEERTLVELANAGDRDALTTLLTRYQARLFAICRRMVSEEHTALELTQDALVTIIEKLHTFDGRAKLSTWLIRITMNLCLTHRRKQKLRPRPIDTSQATERGGLSGVGSPASVSSPAVEHNPGSRVQPTERQRVLDALHALTDEQHAIVVLRDIQGLSYDSIGYALELAPGTVKSRLARARAALRTALEQDKAEPSTNE